MFIFGSDCTITLVQNVTLTPLPYTLETLREQPNEIELAPLVGYILPLTTIKNDLIPNTILGCLVTRLSDDTIEPLAKLIETGSRNTFGFFLNRIVEQRKYLNLTLTSFQLRADRDDALYLKLDITGDETADWDPTTPDIPWEQQPTLEYREGDIKLNGKDLHGIYRFSLTRIFGEYINTILQLHYALAENHPLNNLRTAEHIELTFGERLRFRATKLKLLSFEANTDNAEEILIYRRYRIDGDLTIETRDQQGEWGRAE